MSKFKQKKEVQLPSIQQKPAGSPGSCQLCHHQTAGVLSGYEWQECAKGWTDKLNGQRRDMIGVINNTCGNYRPRA